MSHLAVITTPTQPYHLVKEINGKYFKIESINTLSDALALHLPAFRKLYEISGTKDEVAREIMRLVAAQLS